MFEYFEVIISSSILVVIVEFVFKEFVLSKPSIIQTLDSFSLKAVE